MATIDISKCDKAAVLAALYNDARPQGMGFLHFKAEPMREEQAAELLKTQSYFDYVQGRVMKVDIKGDTLKTALYDRDNGPGAALRALQSAGLSVSLQPDATAK